MLEVGEGLLLSWHSGWGIGEEKRKERKGYQSMIGVNTIIIYVKLERGKDFPWMLKLTGGSLQGNVVSTCLGN